VETSLVVKKSPLVRRAVIGAITAAPVLSLTNAWFRC